MAFRKAPLRLLLRPDKPCPTWKDCGMLVLDHWIPDRATGKSVPVLTCSHGPEQEVKQTHSCGDDSSRQPWLPLHLPLLG